MNNFVQQENFLIGSQKDIEALASKQKCRLLVISDTHGDYGKFIDIVREYGPDCDALVFCGDGTADICSCIEESENNLKFKEMFPPVIAIVHGNCDYDNYELSNSSSINNPYFVCFEAAGRQIFVTHGHNYNVYRGPEFLASEAANYHADFVFYGHTHCAKSEEINGTLIMNPGSISLPRGNPVPSFAIVEFPGNTERYDFQFYGIQESVFKKNQFFPVNFY